ncbi:hypothetical protein [Fischerella sp. JS2]|uniref:hypothetical protein n=1 Tax=Fischerella sp. JS2 TaxID=2597771 RepID=UPI0028E62C84|nr:hypothetical protein [Fischerella sp. JS2]
MARSFFSCEHDIDLPKEEPVFKIEPNQHNSRFTVTTSGSYDMCFALFQMFKQQQKKPFLIPKALDVEDYKELGFETEEELESFLYIQEFIESEDFNNIGYSHISYEDYMSNFE